MSRAGSTITTSALSPGRRPPPGSPSHCAVPSVSLCTACATEIAVGGTLYGPTYTPAGNSPGGYTPISQSAVTGSGTSGDPYRIVTFPNACRSS